MAGSTSPSPRWARQSNVSLAFRRAKVCLPVEWRPRFSLSPHTASRWCDVGRAVWWMGRVASSTPNGNCGHLPPHSFWYRLMNTAQALQKVPNPTADSCVVKWAQNPSFHRWSWDVVLSSISTSFYIYPCEFLSSVTLGVWLHKLFMVFWDPKASPQRMLWYGKLPEHLSWPRNMKKTP